MRALPNAVRLWFYSPITVTRDPRPAPALGRSPAPERASGADHTRISGPERGRRPRDREEVLVRESRARSRPVGVCLPACACLPIVPLDLLLRRSAPNTARAHVCCCVFALRRETRRRRRRALDLCCLSCCWVDGSSSSRSRPPFPARWIGWRPADGVAVCSSLRAVEALVSYGSPRAVLTCVVWLTASSVDRLTVSPLT